MRLLIVVNADWFFLSHRLPIALAAQRAGYEVHVAFPVTQDVENLERYGFIVHPISFHRSEFGLFGISRLFLIFLFLFWKISPTVLHLVTIKPVLIGGLAARLSPVGGVVYAVSGLGHVYLSRGFFSFLRKKIVQILYKFALGFRNKIVILQNSDDLREIQSITRIDHNQLFVITGSGVDLKKFYYTPLPQGVPIILMASRLLITKGVREYVAAAAKLRDAGLKVRFWLVGDIDFENPASIKSDELEKWKRQGDVELLGKSIDVATLMTQCYLVVLPSYREGLPKVLLEAAACGRPIITTDTPGCRESIINGFTGILIPSQDICSLAKAIRNLIENRVAAGAMGKNARIRAERLFDVQDVVDKHLQIYLSLVRQT